MYIDDLKKSLIQKIMNLSNEELLLQINELLEENIFGYDGKGNLITKSQYIREMDELMKKIEAGEEKLHTNEEVIKMLTDEFNLNK